MAKKRFWIVAFAAVAVAVVVCLSFLAKGDIMNYSNKYEGVDLSAREDEKENKYVYKQYLEDHSDIPAAEEDIVINLQDNKCENGVVKMESSYQGETDVLYTNQGTTVKWEVDVPKDGFYQLYTEYLLPESRGIAAQRSIYINGEIPFYEAEYISLGRIWENAGEIRVDSRGNQYRPSRREVFAWQSETLKDSMGYVAEPFLFYLQAGKNEIGIQAVEEPCAYKTIKLLGNKHKTPTYEEYLAYWQNQGVGGENRNYSQTYEGEASSRQSEPSLYAMSDSSSPITSPEPSVNYKVLNYIGGEKWRQSGQWIEWDITVPENGFYNFTLKVRQNYQRGGTASRKVMIDGEVLFKELENIPFVFTKDWEYITLGNEQNVPYQFYLAKGQHVMRLEAALGEMGEVLSRVDNSIYKLNEIYRTFLVYTGSIPDQFREYNLDRIFPETMEAMDLESKRLYKIVDDLVARSGQKNINTSRAQALAIQLEKFMEDPNDITLEFSNFKDNITALGTASLDMRYSRLDIDSFEITSTDRKPTEKKAGFFRSAGYEIESLVASMFRDYNSVGDVYDDSANDVVTVWITTGRDQANILKNMIDETFTSRTGIKVNVQLVDPGVVLRAIVADRGPNVVLGVGAQTPVDYALRNSVEDLTQFSDLNDVLSQYSESSYRQYKLDQKLYAIPETQGFSVMFYRTDIFKQLNLSPPQTWEDLVNLFPTIQGNNMDIGVLGIYNTLLYQNGGDLYNSDGTKTIINEESGVKAFQDYTKYFVDYGCSVAYDFVSRFRSGEMPLGIAGYGTFNSLTVSAPEIRGLWDFAVIPGTKRKDASGKEYIDRSEPITGTGTILVKTDDDVIRNKSWEFMKWWAEGDTQLWFGQEMEALLGASARYGTANQDAFARLSWSSKNLETLMEQWKWTVGVREVPGSYYTERHINNAFRKVINNDDDPRKTIVNYARIIDNELEKKRTEFGITLGE